MSFHILIHDDISIAQLIEIDKNGGRVLKTPHIGNIYPNNLALISLGIPALLYDRTIGAKDKSFHPHKIVYNGITEQIANPDILSTHSKLEFQPKNFIIEKDFSGMKIVDLHLGILKQAFPQGKIFTYTQYLEDNKKIVSKIVKVIAKNFPQIWYRFVNEDGTIEKADNLTSEQILAKGIFGIDDDLRGFIIPNPVNILLHGTVDVMKFQTRDIYLLSGPDMYMYMKNYEVVLDKMYSYIKDTLDLDLPNNVNCHIIPAMKMRFIVIKDDKEILNELVELYEDYVAANTATRDLFNSSKERSGIRFQVDKKDEIKTKIIACIDKNYSTFKKTMFYDVSMSNCFTQYDLSVSRGLYIHPWAIENKLSDVTSAFLFLDRCFKTIKKI